MAKFSGGRSTRKYGRNKAKCERYRLQGRREKHKNKHCLKSNGKPYEVVRRESRLANGLPVDK